MSGECPGDNAARSTCLFGLFSLRHTGKSIKHPNEKHPQLRACLISKPHYCVFAATFSLFNKHVGRSLSVLFLLPLVLIEKTRNTHVSPA